MVTITRRSGRNKQARVGAASYFAVFLCGFAASREINRRTVASRQVAKTQSSAKTIKALLVLAR